VTTAGADASRQELSEGDAEQLHLWLQRFDHRGGGRGLDLEPWYIDGRVPDNASERDKEELAHTVFEILRELTPNHGFLHYADVEHEYARFYPDRIDALSFADLFVDGETSAFVAADRSWGVVSFGWVAPLVVCFFGEGLVSRLRARLPTLLDHLLPLDL
jgi:hypothetical protein